MRPRNDCARVALSPRETNCSTPPSGALWLHEIKHDGFRVMAQPGLTASRSR
jgi:ATP-dependent DNA ligase